MMRPENRTHFRDYTLEPVTRPHVEYGVRRKFMPHSTPPTEKVIHVLRRLSELIPLLRGHEIVPDISDLPLLLPATKVQ